MGIYQDGVAIHQRGYGSANLEHSISITPSTVFHIASLSKQFTAVAAGLLAREGRISLDDPIRQYIPELPVHIAVTFRHIIHHTSGLRDQWDLLRLAGWRHEDIKKTDDILQLAVRQETLNFPSGARFQYINTGYTLIGIAVERITGLSLREYTSRFIFEPLGMSQTWFHDHYGEIVRNRAQAYSRDADSVIRINMPAYETVGPTGLFSTVEDFAQWEHNFIFPKVGDAEFIAQMLAPAKFDDGQPQQHGYGFGLVTGTYRGLETVEHAGGDAGYRSHYLRFPVERFAVAIFCNFSELKPGELARRIADICLSDRLSAPGSDFSNTPAWAGRAAGVSVLSADELEAKVGLYRDSITGMTCRIKIKGSRLVLIGNTDVEYELVGTGPERFQFSGIDAECIFETESKMVVRYAGQVAAACERIEDELPAPVALAPADYVGTYCSDELDAQYRIELSNQNLIMRRAKYPADTLERLAGDEFSTKGEGFHVRFVRDHVGKVDGLVLTTERVWNARFVRTSKQALVPTTNGR